MGRRKQYLDEDMDSSEDEDGRINFDTMDQDDDELEGFIGFRPAASKKRQKRFAEDMGDTDDDDEVTTRPQSMAAAAIGTSAFLPAKKNPVKDRITTQDNNKRSSTPSRDSSASPSPGPGFAAFTKHTTGFGQKILEKMGWKAGKGLGAGGEGMINPVETKQRPKGMGMGFRGFEERTAQAKMEAGVPLSSDDDDDAEKNITKATPRQAWKKQPPTSTTTRPSSAIPKKKKTTYQTANDIQLSQQQQQQQKVIDMTGPSIREINLADIKRTDSPTLMETTTRLPELRHNLRLIVDLARGDLDNLIREKQITLNKWTELKASVVEIEERQQADHARQLRVNQVQVIALELQKRSRDVLANGTMESNTISGLFGDCLDQLQTHYLDQVGVLGLDALVVSVWAPVMKYKSITWNVLADPTWLVDDVKRWRPLLRCNDDDQKKKKKKSRQLQPQQHVVATPFETMMNTIWLGKVRSAINNLWQVRDPDAVIQLLEAWQPVLPRFIYENIINQLILPKLSHAVSDWDPRTDEQLVHTWIHPWLPLLQAWRLADLFTTIRHKLAVVLKQWHPSDESALEVIGRWKDVWTKTQMDTFLQKNILPKLTQVLRQEFIINPRDQPSIDPLAWCLAWQGILADRVFAMLLENEVFRPWLRVLYQWLTSNQVNFDEIKEWYLWWKQVFASLGVANDHPVFIKCTRIALDMMSAASAGEPIDPPSI
ncbi:GC-rich sequence DNA-binding factor-like protein-domain-containing protein [Chlamydoabsidia padenii]|nr:GC-rich sequence DNA-binding factor-like protein-domain-containing protein [Chlamydoabsidia padenii]